MNQTTVLRWVIGLALVAVLIGVLALQTGQENHEADSSAALAMPAEQRHRANAAEMAEQRILNQQLQEQLQEVRADAEEKGSRVQELQKQVAKAEAKNEARSKAGHLLRDPEMQKVLKEEAKSGVQRSVAALFDAGLADYLKLNEPQRGALNQLLMERGSIAWEKVLIPMTTGGLDSASIAAAGREAGQAYAGNVAQIRGLLGDDGFAVYEWFERTQPDRDRMQQFTPQFANASQDLSEHQQDQLLALMMEERSNSRLPEDSSNPAKIDYEHFHETFTHDRVEAFFQEIQAINQRIEQRAQVVLTAEQTTLLRNLLASQLQRSKFTTWNTMAIMGERR